MKEDKKVWFIIIVLFLVGVLVYFWCNKNTIEKFVTDDVYVDEGVLAVVKEWREYESSAYKFSFLYPKNLLFTTEEDDHFKIQNFDSITTPRNSSGKFWVEFFIYTTIDEPICPDNISDYETYQKSSLTFYRGKTTADENNEHWGYEVLCVNLGSYNLYIQGQDETGLGNLERVFNSLRFHVF